MRDKIQNHIAYALAQANRGVHLRFGELLKAEGIQVEHWRVLEVLSDESGRSMGELAEAVLMNHPALTKMIDRMVAAGIVHRSLDAADNRRVLVYVTDKGLELYRRAHRLAVRLDREFIDKIGAENALELKRMLQMLSSGHSRSHRPTVKAARRGAAPGPRPESGTSGVPA